MQYFVDEFLYQSHLFSPLKDLQTPHPVVGTLFECFFVIFVHSRSRDTEKFWID
jgi:hypothetical protein